MTRFLFYVVFLLCVPLVPLRAEGSHLPGITPSHGLTVEGRDRAGGEKEPGPAVAPSSSFSTRWNEPLVATTPVDPRPDLLRRGLAQRFPEEEADTEEMRTAEAEAIAARRGVWAEACCRVLSPEEAAAFVQSWRVVRGKLASVTVRREVTYLNFGPDWRTDFTVMIPSQVRRRMQRPPAGSQTQTVWVPGQEVEVRGWIRWQGGPSITLDVPEQIRGVPPS